MDLNLNRNKMHFQRCSAALKVATVLLPLQSFVIHEKIQQRRYLVSQQVSSDCLLVYSRPSHFDGCAVFQNNT